MKRARAAFGIAALAVALIAALATNQWRQRSASTTVAADETAVPIADASSSPTKTTASDPLRSGSLRGTEIDGDVRFDERGEPIADAALRRLFDYHLSVVGEQSLDGIRAALKRTLSARWDATQVARVMALFERYLDYRRASAESPRAADPDPARRLAEAKRLRRQYLGDAMATGFFAEEEALAELTLRRAQIAADARLTPDAKRDALRALDEAAGYDARAAADLPAVAAAQAADLERRGLTAEQRAAERSALWGPEAAQRLAALDAEQSAWDARVRRYADARARIAADARLDASARAQAIARLRAQSFSSNEQRRIASLEAIGQLDAALSDGR